MGQGLTHRPSREEVTKADSTIPAVLYVGHTASLGGGEIALLNLVAELDKARFRPVVLLFSDGPLAERLRQISVQVEILPLDRNVLNTRKDSLGAGSILKLGRVLGTTTHVARVARAIRRIKPSIVHANSLKADIIAGLAARVTRTPLIWHVRDRIADDYLPPTVARLFRWLACWIPNRIIANSAATLETLNASSDCPSEALVIHNGTVIHDGTPVPLEVPPSGNRERPVVGLIGRISPWKGQDVFIRAAGVARQRGVDFEGRLIGAALFGEAEFERSLHAQVKEAGLEDVISFVGFKSDVHAEIAKLDIVIHASTVPEPFGQVIIEGMAAARPVIATSAGGVLEIVEDGKTGVLVPPGDAEALADAIEMLIRDPARASRIGQAAREAVISRFSIARVARDVEALYDRMLAAGN